MTARTPYRMTRHTPDGRQVTTTYNFDPCPRCHDPFTCPYPVCLQELPQHLGNPYVVAYTAAVHALAKHGLSRDQIAAILSISRTSVYRHLRRPVPPVSTGPLPRPASPSRQASPT